MLESQHRTKFSETPMGKFLVRNELSSTLIVYPAMIYGEKKPKQLPFCSFMMSVYDNEVKIGCMRCFW
jgi:hypothetical protein